MSAPERERRVLQSSRGLERNSTQLVQEQQTAREDDQRNPEVDVGRDHAKQILGSAGFDWGSHSLRKMAC